MKIGHGDILARLSGGHSYNKNLKIVNGVPHELPIFGFAHTRGQEDESLWYSSRSLRFGRGGRHSQKRQCSREDMGGEQERKESHQNEQSYILLQLWNIFSYKPVLTFSTEQITIFYSCEFKF